MSLEAKLFILAVCALTFLIIAVAAMAWESDERDRQLCREVPEACKCFLK